MKNLYGEQVKDKEQENVRALKQQYMELLNVGANKNPMKFKTDQFPIASAIVIFEKPKARDVCVFAHNRYSPAYTLNCVKKVPLEFLFRGHYPLTVS